MSNQSRCRASLIVTSIPSSTHSLQTSKLCSIAWSLGSIGSASNSPLRSLFSSSVKNSNLLRQLLRSVRNISLLKDLIRHLLNKIISPATSSAAYSGNCSDDSSASETYFSRPRESAESSRVLIGDYKGYGNPTHVHWGPPSRSSSVIYCRDVDFLDLKGNAFGVQARRSSTEHSTTPCSFNFTHAPRSYISDYFRSHIALLGNSSPLHTRYLQLRMNEPCSGPSRVTQW